MGAPGEKVNMQSIVCTDVKFVTYGGEDPKDNGRVGNRVMLSMRGRRWLYRVFTQSVVFHE